MITISHLTKIFEGKGPRVTALEDVNLEIGKGDIYGIIGMSGAGKSTLLRCLTLLERPTSGQIMLAGQDIASLSGAQLWEGTLETLYMTLFATLFAYVLGLPMGVLLTVTKAGGVAPAPRFNAVFGWLVNLLRSLPFIILMFFIIPFTRLLVGTSIGATAALVPLTLSAAPFIARMVEQSLEEIDTGVIEAAQCMGATRWQIVTRVLLVESVPSLLRGLSISLITILGYTAITGSVGAGGLGNLAFRFGYQRYQKPVMYATVLLLILLVCVIQIIFDLAARKADKRTR